jgi:hypothetical protein
MQTKQVDQVVGEAVEQQAEGIGQESGAGPASQPWLGSANRAFYLVEHTQTGPVCRNHQRFGFSLVYSAPARTHSPENCGSGIRRRQYVNPK